MIIVISGGVGSGKNTTMTHHAMKCEKVFANYSLKGHKNFTRLKWHHIMKDKGEDIKGKKDRYVVNWDFWNRPENKNCDIFIDEVQNVAGARSFSDVRNIRFNEWVSQIRKIWSASGDMTIINRLSRADNNVFNAVIDDALTMSRNLWLCTQRPHKLDKDERELCHVFIQCEKLTEAGHTFILNRYFFGDDNYSALERYYAGANPKKAVFYADPLFKHFDSYEIIGAGGYL